jgi:nitrilase
MEGAKKGGMLTVIKVAAVQAAPVFLDREATLDKVVTLIEKAAAEGAGLIVFPETFIPTYPDWVWRTTAFSPQSADLFARLLDQSVVVPSVTTEAIGEAAARTHAYVSIGVNEREETGSTLYNTQLYFDNDGTLIAKHRKLMPTGGERLVWGMGDGSTLDVLQTPFGRLGGLTCWENYMPLARAALYAKGIEIYLAPTWDNSDIWVASMQHIAKEGRMFVVGVNFCMRGSDVPAGVPARDEIYGGEEDWLSKGNSVIVAPSGHILAGPLVGEEGIIYADIDVADAQRERHQFDPVGHYARAEVLQLRVRTDAARAVVFEEHPEEPDNR